MELKIKRKTPQNQKKSPNGPNKGVKGSLLPSPGKCGAKIPDTDPVLYCMKKPAKKSFRCKEHQEANPLLIPQKDRKSFYRQALEQVENNPAWLTLEYQLKEAVALKNLVLELLENELKTANDQDREADVKKIMDALAAQDVVMKKALAMEDLKIRKGFYLSLEQFHQMKTALFAKVMKFVLPEDREKLLLESKTIITPAQRAQLQEQRQAIEAEIIGQKL